MPNSFFWSTFTHFERNLKHDSSNEMVPGENMLSSPTLPLEDKVKNIRQQHKQITDFITYVRSQQYIESEENRSSFTGLYMCAFCHGIESILDDKFDDVIHIENEMLNGSELTLLSILKWLDPASVVLETILKAIRQIRNKEIRGSKLIDLCRSSKYNGNPTTEKVFERIQEFCLQPFFMQIQGWILKAELFDPYDEFFIQISVEKNESDGALATSSISFNSTRKMERSLEVKEMPLYVVNYQLLPEFIPAGLAKRIVFIGECRTISKHQENFRGDISTVNQGVKDDYVLKTLQEICHKKPFCFITMAIKIGEIWSTVNRDIRKLANEVGNVQDQFLKINDVYLLGRGELFQEFLLKARDILESKVTIRTERMLNKALEAAMYNVYLTDNADLIGNVEFAVFKSSRNLEVVAEDIVQIVIKIKWPLQYLFTPQIMDSYNRIFRFLLKLKKAQMDIHSVWLNAKENMLAIEVRNQLLALLGNLQNYCFTVVIANEVNILRLTLEKSDTYTELKNGLRLFLSNINSQLFIFLDEVMSHFLAIFVLCGVFSKLIHKPSPCLYPNLELFKQKMDDTVRSMFHFFETVSGQIDASNIENLLINLDPNRYFRNKYAM